MQHLEGSGTPVLYIGRTVLKGKKKFYYYPQMCLSITQMVIYVQVLRLKFCTHCMDIFFSAFYTFCQSLSP